MDAGHYRRPQPRQPSVLSSYGYQDHNYQAPSDYLEEYTRDGQPFVRMVCAPGKRPDYNRSECVKAFTETGRCKKGSKWNPFTGTCTEENIDPQIGWSWEGDQLRNVGSSSNGMDGWAFANKLPLGSKWSIQREQAPREQAQVPRGLPSTYGSV